LQQQAIAILRELEKAYDRSYSEPKLSLCSQWLTDNFYIARNEARGVILALRRVKLEKIAPNSEKELSLFIPVLKLNLLRKLVKAVNSEDAVSVAEVFSAFRKLNSFDISEVLEAASPVHKLLMRDKAYRLMNSYSRAVYRRKIAKLAKKRGVSEISVTRRVLPTLHSTLSRVRLNEPNLPPRLDLSKGIPRRGRTLVTISALITDNLSADELSSRLEQYYLSNCEDNLLFCILMDLKEAETETLPGDYDLISHAADKIRGLNDKYGDRFALFTRPRSMYRNDAIWRPWERKRGAILSLCRFLRGRETNLRLVEGTVHDIYYLLLLDADTRPAIGSIKELIATALHPINRPRISKKTNTVTRGYGILQPRIGVELSCSNKNLFTRIFSGYGGADPYGAVCGDFYQDTFGEASFNGKGLAHVDAYLHCLDNRLPEGQVLSHDLLEGSYLRVGFVGDIEFLDGFPTTLKSFLAREHRWIRGDWQLLPFLKDKDISALNKIKILGNLRRSLTFVHTEPRSWLLAPFRAINSVNAAATALHRLYGSKKGLLDWTTSAAKEKPKPIKKRSALTAPDREYLLHCAKDIWKFFESNLTESSNWLPPDNVASKKGGSELIPAERTSPTNIGLAMLSVIAACELGFTSRERSEMILREMLNTLLKLQKWHGHLYNWYDTKTLQPLEPRYVSTVDSGNLSCCLVAVESFLRDDTARQTALEMDFALLYDAERRLFHIGYDCTDDALSDSYYDLLCSESRLTSYFAIASGQVSYKHWRSLGRAGLRSWSGTMFEYLMPMLLLPHEKGSLLYSAARFCVNKQMKYSEPWGISESAYAERNDCGDYSYKAHGVPELTLRPDMPDSSVFAPYASFLALPIEPESSIENLKKLETLGAYGEYGFAEAVDGGNVLRCFMAHHLGMSLISIANTLRENVFHKYFLDEPMMKAHLTLVEEKTPRRFELLRSYSPYRRKRVRHREEPEFLEIKTKLAEAVGGKVYAPDGSLLLKDFQVIGGRAKYTPVLADERDWNAHPAFLKLQLERVRMKDGTLILRRRNGGNAKPLELKFPFGRVKLNREYAPPTYLHILFHGGNRKARERDIIEHCVGRPGLWKFGISGDYPTLYREVADTDGSIESAEKLIAEHQSLRELGIRYDLILGMRDCAEYGTPTQSQLGGERDGVYMVDALSPELPKMLAMVDLVLE